MRALALLAACAVALAACESPSPPPSPPREPAGEASPQDPSARPSDPPETGLGLLYAQGRSLLRLDLASGAMTTSLRLPSTDVSLSPDGTSFVAIRETSPEGSEEGYVAPEVLLGETNAGDAPPVQLGPGRAAIWSGDGSRLGIIDGDGTRELIMVFEPDTTTRYETDTWGQRWTFVGWHEDEIVAIGSESGVVAADPSGGAVRGLKMAPGELWGVSPVDRGVLISVDGAGRATLQRGSERTPIDVDGVLADGTWSWDGRHVAVVVLGGARSYLVVVDVPTGEVNTVAEGERAQGNVVWAPDGRAFAFVRVDPEQRDRLQVVICRGTSDCEPGFTWVRGVKLLGFAS